MDQLSIRLRNFYTQFAASRESGQGLAEYGLILALLAVIVIVALTDLGSAIVNELTKLAGAL
jgi:pilus assembly protein Flp/PilA